MKPKGLAKTLLGSSALTAAIVVSFASLNANASTIAWDGDTSTAWATGTNWTGDVAPANDLVTDIALFNLATYPNQPDAGTTSVNGIQIGDGSTATGALTLSGTSLTLGSSGINMLANSGAATISSPVTLGAAQSWLNNSSSLLTVSGTVANGGFLLTSGGSGNTTISGLMSGTGGLTKSGAGTLTLSGLNTFTGNITISSGTLAAGTGISGATATNIASNLGDLGTGSGARSITVNNGGVLSLTGGNVLGTGGSTGTLSNLTLNVNQGGVFQTGSQTTTGGFWNKIGAVNLDGGTIRVGSGANTSSFQGLALIGTITVGGSSTTASSIENFAGSLSTSNGVHLGQNGASTITFNVADVTGSSASDLDVSVRLHNTSNNQAAGSLTKTGAGTMTLSGANTYTGTTTVNAGTLAITGASANTGAINVAGGTLILSNTVGTNTANAQFRVGTVTNTGATMKITSGANITNRFNLFVGDAGAGTGGGAVYQSGGTLTLTQAAGIDNLRIGSNTGGYGYYKLSGGALTTNEVGIGASLNGTTGVMDVTGGTFTSNGWITVGRGGTTSSGVLNATGGSVTGTRIHMNYAGTSGTTSVLNVGGGSGAAAVNTVGSATLGLDLANGTIAGTNGVANLLTNGTLTTGLVTAGQAAPTALLNFNGGTLKAATTNAGANFLTSANVDAVTVYSGGGTIDNNGTNITIGKALAGATGNGVTSIAVANGGSGYVGAPLVTIGGGTGNTATGYAVMEDDGTGNGTFRVASIVVTSPGTYTVDPTTVALTGGGASTAASGFTVNTATNTSGGMTFAGSGTTTLTGANTYTGGTTISNGTVALSGAGSLASTGAVDVSASGATLDISGITDSSTTIGSLAGVSGSSVVLGGKNLALGNSLNTTFGGVISGTGALTKLGSGTTTFAGANTYTGATSINAGTLALAATGSLTSTQLSVSNGATFNVSAVTGYQVGSGVTLTNNGTVTGDVTVNGTVNGSGTFNGAVTVNGALNPGNSPGTVTFTNGLALAASSNLGWELIANTESGAGTNFDQILVTGGALSIADGATLNLAFGGTVDFTDTFWSTDRSWTVISFNGEGDEGALTLGSITGGAGNFNEFGSFSTSNDNGNQVLTWTAVPEPTAALLGGLGMLGLLRRRRVA